MTVTTVAATDEHTAGVPLQLSLELTQRCQAQCVTCYTESGPWGTDGEMTAENRVLVLDQAAELGVVAVQYIGGEPTLYRGQGGLPRLIDHAVGLGLDVEVFSNLIRIPAPLWVSLRRPGVSLATSYYSTDAAEHDVITRRPGSYEMTKANIAKAIEYGIPLRVGIIRVHEDQRIAEARDELIELGVDPAWIGGDDVRALGRAAGATGGGDSGSAGELCGHAPAPAWLYPLHRRGHRLPDSRGVGSGGNVRTTSLHEFSTARRGRSCRRRSQPPAPAPMRAGPRTLARRPPAAPLQLLGPGRELLPDIRTAASRPHTPGTWAARCRCS